MVVWGNGVVGVDVVEFCVWGGVFAEVADDCAVGQAVVVFAVVGQFCLSQVGGAGVFLAFDGEKHVVAVGVHVLLPQFVEVVHVFEADGVYRVFFAVFFAVVE